MLVHQRVQVGDKSHETWFQFLPRCHTSRTFVHQHPVTGVTFPPEDQQLCGCWKPSLLSRATRLAKRAKVGDEMRDEDEVLQLVPTFYQLSKGWILHWHLCSWNSRAAWSVWPLSKLESWAQGELWCVRKPLFLYEIWCFRYFSAWCIDAVSISDLRFLGMHLVICFYGFGLTATILYEIIVRPSGGWDWTSTDNKLLKGWKKQRSNL